MRFSNPENALREVADQVLAGNDEPLFRKMLAHMIHPDKRPVSGCKLVLKRSGHAPRKARNFALEEFLERQIDIHGVPTKIVFYEAEKRFGVSRSTVLDVLKRSREARDWEFFEDMKKRDLELAKHGHPDYQPIWSPNK